MKLLKRILFLSFILIGFTACVEDDAVSPISPPAWTQGTWISENNQNLKIVVTPDNVIQYENNKVTTDFFEDWKVYMGAFDSNVKEESNSTKYIIYTKESGNEKFHEEYVFEKTSDADVIKIDGDIYKK